MSPGNRPVGLEVGRVDEPEDPAGRIDGELGLVGSAREGVDQGIPIGIGRIDVEGEGQVLGSAGGCGVVKTGAYSFKSVTVTLTA